MKMKQPRRAWLIALIACAVLILPLAVSGSGLTDSDPLISLSYLTGTYQQQIIAEMQKQITARSQELTDTLDQRISDVRTAAGSSQAPASTHTTVNLTAGSSYTVPDGAEFLFLSGSAKATGAGLTDTTLGQSVAASAALTENHLYVAGTAVAIQSETAVKILIRK